MVLMTSLSAACSVFGIRSSYEQLNYDLVEQIGPVEVRRYDSRLVAEIQNAKDDNDAFMSLFRYISGQNIASEKLAMTVPVEVSGTAGAKIPMTTPVEVDRTANGVKMRFFLPSSYSEASAPKPTDTRIKIVALPRATVAALRYSGFATDSKFAARSDELLASLQGSAWTVDGTPSFLGYDPPFAVPFLRRNEVIVPVRSELPLTPDK